MTLSQISTRLFVLTGASICSAALLFGTTQAHAAPTGNAYYQAELAQAPLKQKELVRGVFVKCDGTACRAPIASSAAKNMCISVAREFGAVTAFKAGDRAFDAAEITKCNGGNKTNVAKK